MSDDPFLGQVIDVYRIEKRLGRGGMGTVYLARDVELDRWVAIKVLPADFSRRESFLARFKREARTLARFNHPAILQIYTVGLLPGGEPYIVMEYVPGGTLAEWLARDEQGQRPLTTPQRLTIMQQVVEALAVVHSENVVHRDLKPSNILMRSDGTPVLADMGIVSLREATMRLTQTNQTPGTPYYMSPEQIRGEPLDGRSDIYAFGIILYELLAGQSPFGREVLAVVMDKHLHEPPPPLADLRPDLNATTCDMVHTCLQKSPADRFQSAAELAATMVQVIEQEEAYQPQSERSARWRHWPKAVYPILVLLVTGLFWLFSQGDDNADGLTRAGDSVTIADQRSVAATLFPTATRTAAVPNQLPTQPPPTMAPPATETPTAAPSATALPSATPLPTLTPLIMVVTITPTAAGYQLDTVVEDFEYANDELMQSQYWINAPGNELVLSLVREPTAVSGDRALAMTFRVNNPPPADYVGFERQQTTPLDWRGHSELCLWVNNDGFDGNLVVQFREQAGETWKYEVSLDNLSAGEVCAPLSTVVFSLIDESSHQNGSIDLSAIENYAFYLGTGGITAGVVYLDGINLRP